VPVTKTDTGGQVENTKVIEITLVKNSAKSPRNFGIRGALVGEALREWSTMGRSELAEATVYQKHRSLLSRKTTYRG